MKYISTRGQCAPVDFETAVMTGLAPDGGLFLPDRIPDVSDKLEKWSRLAYPDLACEIFRLFCGIPRAELKRIIEKSYSAFSHPAIAPLKRFDNLYLLELFHGPTLAFKDFALQFLGNLFEYFLRRSGKELNLVAATSGDTGSAAIAGVKGKKNIRIFVLFPFGRVSPAQELQMTTVLDKNVCCLAVRGSFDDCQNIVKSLLSDLNFRSEFSLGAVNSINWARILAQVVYYFYAYFQVRSLSGQERVSFAVPTGNFGDIFAGYFARRMGLPVARLVLATNRNRILADFFEKGVYERGMVRQTLSPSMDIQVASNFERYLYYRLGKDPAKVRGIMAKFARDGKFTLRDMGLKTRDKLFVAASADTPATLSEIRRCWRENNYVLDPHTAVGVHAAGNFLSGREPMICLATAHPAKFENAVKRALGRDFSRCREQVLHPALEALKKKKTRRFVLPADVDKVKSFIIAGVNDS